MTTIRDDHGEPVTLETCRQCGIRFVPAECCDSGFCWYCCPCVVCSDERREDALAEWENRWWRV